MLTSYSPWHWHLWSFFSSVQIKEPAELMTHESSTIRGHHNIGIHPEDRGMGPYSSYGMHTLFLFTYSLWQLYSILCNTVFWNAFVFYGEGDHVSELRSSFPVGDHHYTYLYMYEYLYHQVSWLNRCLKNSWGKNCVAIKVWRWKVSKATQQQ